MKVILYMAITPNGMIARKDGDSDWVSDADVESFTKICRRAKTVIMGRNTYDVLYPNYLPLETGTHIVRTNNISLSSDNPTVKFTKASAEEIISSIENNTDEVCVIGGSQTTTDFMKKGLIDEVYFDIEPLLIGDGMPIFKPAAFEYQLKLLDINKLSDQTIQLHYQVIK